MTLEAKDIIYLVTYIISLMGIIFAIQGVIKDIKRDTRLIKNIIFGERGNLNVIDAGCCRKYRDEVFTAIRRNENFYDMIIGELKQHSEMLIELKLLVALKNDKKEND